ncbi:hypothetical protein [Neisseria elongata]|uniref:hypothetical protein n=1 Tax=Neisseria elongata TaxID=495 RepID=UPI000D305C51|nr:hypothetical protein [Neisseria elongata]
MNTKATLTAVLLLAASAAFAAPAENDKQQGIEAFCNAAANMAYDSMLSGLKGEKHPAIQKKLEAKYLKPFADDKNLSGIMGEQIKYALKKTEVILKEAKQAGFKAKPAEYEELAMEAGRAEMEVCMKNMAE